MHVAGVGRFDVPEGGGSILSWSVGATTAENQPVFGLVTNEINNADRVRFNSDGDSWFNGGNVGIGTKNPSQKLDIHGKFTVNSDGTALWGNIPNGITGRLSWDGGATGKIILRAEANNTLNLGANGSHNHIVIGTGGNVGIGTTTPGASLDLNSSSVDTTLLVRNATQTLRIDQNSIRSLTNNDISITTSGNTSQLFLKKDGNVGIGTTDPGAALDVAGSFKLNNTAGSTLYPTSNDVYKNGTTSSLKHSIILNTAGWRNASVIESVTGTAPSGFSTEGLYLNATYGSNVFTSASVHVDCNTGNGDISFLTGTGAAAPTTKFKLQNNGNVGIGTTSPDEKLVIQGGVKILSTNKLSFSNTSNQTYIHGVTSNRMAFGTNSVERIRIDEFGNVGIGTTDPGGKLHLLDSRTTTHTDYTLTVQNDGATPHGLRVHQKNADPSLTGASSGYSILTTSGSFQCFYVTNNGDTFNKYGNYGVISDKRLKENITDATAKTEDLKKVRVVNYNLIKDDTKQIGVIAQELEQVFPGLVSESEHQDGETYKSVKMSLFIPMLLKGFQEQQQLIEDLRSEVEALKNK